MNFDFEVPASFFEKAEADQGKQRRIGGIVSCETRDRQKEVIVQKGLDFQDFIHNGWFNDNHSKKTVDILGYPEITKYVTKGSQMPDGRIAKADGHWVEGYLLDTPEADKVWELGKALQKTHRRLGFSVEGKILKRADNDKRTIAKAMVRNVAITNCPVNTDSRMEILARSLAAIEQSEPDILEKMLGMGDCSNNETPIGTKTGMGAGQVLAKQSLEHDEKNQKEKKKKKKTKKSLSKKEAFGFIKARLPNANNRQIGRLLTLTSLLKRRVN
jgi:hypothetical protein